MKIQPRALMHENQEELKSEYFYPRDDLDFLGVEVFVSPISGTGVRAKRDYKAGEEVLPLTGILRYSLNQSDLDDHMLMQLDENIWLKGAGNPDDFINHSCDSNLGYNAAGNAYIARRDIKKGEELFFDYVMTDFYGETTMQCSCGSKNCRGEIIGFKQLSKDLKTSLLPYTLPYIRRHYE